jgi:hypothetical protein
MPQSRVEDLPDNVTVMALRRRRGCVADNGADLVELDAGV